MGACAALFTGLTHLRLQPFEPFLGDFETPLELTDCGFGNPFDADASIQLGIHLGVSESCLVNEGAYECAVLLAQFPLSRAWGLGDDRRRFRRGDR